MGNENTQTYQVEVVILIQHKILVFNSPENGYQLDGRINNQTFGDKGLIRMKGWKEVDL